MKQEDGSVIVEGSSLLRDLNRKLGWNLPLGGPKTLNGLILEHFQDIPEPRTSVKIAGYPMEIIQTQDVLERTRRPGRGPRSHSGRNRPLSYVRNGFAHVGSSFALTVLKKPLGLSSLSLRERDRG